MIPFSNITHISSKIPSFYEVANNILPENIFYLVILCACNEGTLKIHKLISNTFITLHYTRINAININYCKSIYIDVFIKFLKNNLIVNFICHIIF